MKYHSIVSKTVDAVMLNSKLTDSEVRRLCLKELCLWLKSDLISSEEKQEIFNKIEDVLQEMEDNEKLEIQRTR